MKKCLYALLITITILLVVTGCGKTRQEKVSEEYQKEYGLSKEEADELAEFEDMMYQEALADAEKDAERAEKKEESEDAFKLYEASDEIKESTVNDAIVQIRNVVVKTDGSLTVKELYDALNKDGSVTIKKGGDEVTDSSLANSGVHSCYIVDEFDYGLCDLDFVNETEAPANIMDCKVINVTAPQYSDNVLNFFYPGNICAGIYSDNDSVKETEWYEKRISEYLPMTYQDATDILTQKGAENVKFYIEEYSFYVYMNEPIYVEEGKKPIWKVINYRYHVDMNTASVDRISVSVEYDKADMANENIEDFSVIKNNGLIDMLRTECIDRMLLLSKFDRTLKESIDILGYYNEKDAFSNPYKVICITDEGYYQALTFSMSKHFDGSYEFWVSPNSDTYSSLEELFAEREYNMEEFVEAD